MRIERNLSQESLAALFPEDEPHHLSWVSKVEKNQINLKLSDVYALADVLKVDPGWLVSGNKYENETVAQLKKMVSGMDDRGKRELLATAEAISDEVERQTTEQVERLLAAFPQMTRVQAERTVQALSGTAPDSDADREAQ